LIVVITAILGTYLVRQQGLRAIGDVQRSFSQLNDPTEPLAHGLMILFSGALLLTPGFFTDAVGFLLLIPQFRVLVFNFVRARIKVQSFTMGNQGHPQEPQPKGGPDIIDGDFEEIPPGKNPTHGSSGWTRH